MGESHFEHVIRQDWRHLEIRKGMVVVLCHAAPGSEMDFVDGKRMAIVLAAGALLHPFRVTKSV